MHWDMILNLLIWAAFLFVWLPLHYRKHKKRMRSLRAINKDHRFSSKYRALKRLNGGSA